MKHLIRPTDWLHGIALHSGDTASLRIKPAPAGAGIRFRRIDLPKGQGEFSALWHNVSHAPLCTRLVNDAGATLSTIEHLMAALAGEGIFDALVEVDGAELPIFDGSALIFARAIRQAGTAPTPGRQPYLQITAPVRVSRGEAWALLEPAPTPSIDVEIDFPDPAIGRQTFCWTQGNTDFLTQLAPARTFCRARDVEAMRASGQARGGSLESAVVVDGVEILTPGGLRFADEFARHKALDALGDLALLGLPVLGRMRSARPGHKLTQELAAAVMSWPECYRVMDGASCVAA